MDLKASGLLLPIQFNPEDLDGTESPSSLMLLFHSPPCQCLCCVFTHLGDHFLADECCRNESSSSFEEVAFFFFLVRFVRSL